MEEVLYNISTYGLKKVIINSPEAWATSNLSIIDGRFVRTEYKDSPERITFRLLTNLISYTWFQGIIQTEHTFKY